MIEKVSFVLPTYNEKDNIADLVRAIHQHVTMPREIIVVDDNSPDGTSQIVQGLIDSGAVPGLKLLTRIHNRGLTNSLRDGIAMASGDAVVWMDCDFSMPPEDITRLLEKLAEGYDVAVGSRFIKGGSFKRGTAGTEDSWLAVLLSRMMNVAIRFILIPSFHDYTSGFIAIRKSVLDKVPLKGDYGEYFIDLMVRVLLLNYKVVEIPYICLPRAKGYSKTGSNLIDYMKRGSKYLWLSVKLFWVKLRYKFLRII